MVGKSSCSLQAGLSCRHWMHCGEILLLATIRQTTMRDVQPGASKRISPLCSLVIIESNVGRFSYSSEAGHLLSSFGAWWRVRESPHHAPNDDERVQTGVSKRISPPCSLVIQSMVGRFFYSPQAGLSRHHSVHGQEILLLATMRQTTTRYVQPGARKKSPHHALNDINRAWWGRFSYLPQAGHLSSSFAA